MKVNKSLYVLTQVSIWMAIFLSPILYLGFEDSLTRLSFFHCLAMPTCLLVAYYCNALWLVPKHFVKGHHSFYFLFNTILVAVLTFVIHLWVKWDGNPFSFFHFLPEGQNMHGHTTGSHVIHALHTIFNLCVSIGVATMINLSLRWTRNEELQHNVMVAQREAELKNLRYQLNPHFMLNTLNNIYALTAFDQTKAQSAIMELSKMLRHVLFENDRAYIDVEDEATFIHSYVNLMKLRLSDHVEIKEEYDIHSTRDVHIVPMLFISLVENAFKHGVSPTEKSFIHIKMYADKESIECEIVNTYYPKTENDKSGSGVGLQSVQRRLDLLYPDRYVWEKGTDNKHHIYSSKITLYDTQLRNN